MTGEGSAGYSNLTPGIYKERYPNGLTWAGLQTCRFYNLCKKATNFSEETARVTVQLTAGMGGSSSFAVARANRSAGTTAKFSVTTGKDYVIGSIENEVMQAGSAGAILDVFLHQLDMKGKEFGELVDRRILGENRGAMGKMSGASSGATITLVSKSQARNFRKGMVIEASDDTIGTTIRANKYTVSSVNYSTKVVTMTATIVGWSSGDYVWLEGEAGSTWQGYLEWVPSTDPGATAFYGVDRTADLWRLAGFRPSSATIEGNYAQTIMNVAAEGSPWGLRAPYVFVSPNDYNKMAKQIENPQRDTVKSKVDANVGFSSIVIETCVGSVKVMPDPRWPDDIGGWFDPGGWTLLSRGAYPPTPKKGDVKEEDGADAWQFRLRGYACLKPTDVSLRESCTFKLVA